MKRLTAVGSAALAIMMTATVPFLAQNAQSDEGPKTAVSEPLPKDFVPEWLKEDVPEWVEPYLGRAGLPAVWRKKSSGPLATGVGGIDFWQANHFINYREETAEYLDKEYTPLEVNYQPGTLPGYEKAAAKYTAGLTSDREKAVALLTKALPNLVKHPTIPPLGQSTRADRNLDDEALLASGNGWCNEQARVFTRLCQVSGIPSRIIFLFYGDDRSGHVVNEFYADGQWIMADPSWFCVLPGADGRLMSAAEAHGSEQGREAAAKAYKARFEEILKLSDEELGGKDPAKVRQAVAKRNDELAVFGVLNYPLPTN